MAAFLDYVAGPGQVPGDEIGDCRAGTPPHRRVARPGAFGPRCRARRSPQRPERRPPPSDEPGGTDGPGPNPDLLAPGSDLGISDTPGDAPGGDDPSAGPSDAPAADQADAAPAMSTVASESPGKRLLALPALLVLALVGLLAGPLVLWLESTGRGPQWLRR